MKYFRETYEGTMGYDKKSSCNSKRKRQRWKETEKKVKSPVMNNWMSNDLRTLLNEIKPGLIERQRTIAIAVAPIHM